MPKLELTVNQVIDLVKQLPKKDKFAVLHALNQETGTRSEEEQSKQEEQQLRALSAKRGLDWDRLSEDDRDVLANKLLR
ncbi:hypothetical protein [Allocoleopsis franciscana]|uniref:Addiction module component n=1 Tax=Allocoleopsis franciscana PCC 7113 TaxID=1173027 RepID=K9WPJ5_9CYAN|nr:hypothetical protein [Allocoleopsis franciscana]AFZ21704.1 hypothetical protein Mic7113_6110 [Allocoleopsis franciscana PCC 7113]